MNVVQNLTGVQWGALFPPGAVQGLDNVEPLLVPARGSVDLDAWEQERGLAAGSVLAELQRRADVRAAVDAGKIAVSGLSKPPTEAEIKASAEAKAAAEAHAAVEAERSAREAAKDAEIAKLRALLAMEAK